MLVPLTDGNHPYTVMMLELIRTHQSRQRSARDAHGAGPADRSRRGLKSAFGRLRPSRPRSRLDPAA